MLTRETGAGGGGGEGGRLVLAARDDAAPTQRFRAGRCGLGCRVRDWFTLWRDPRTTWDRALSLLSFAKAGPSS